MGTVVVAVSDKVMLVSGCLGQNIAALVALAVNSSAVLAECSSALQAAATGGSVSAIVVALYSKNVLMRIQDISAGIAETIAVTVIAVQCNIQPLAALVIFSAAFLFTVKRHNTTTLVMALFSKLFQG